MSARRPQGVVGSRDGLNAADRGMGLWLAWRESSAAQEPRASCQPRGQEDGCRGRPGVAGRQCVAAEGRAISGHVVRRLALKSLYYLRRCGLYQQTFPHRRRKILNLRIGNPSSKNHPRRIYQDPSRKDPPPISSLKSGVPLPGPGPLRARTSPRSWKFFGFRILYFGPWGTSRKSMTSNNRGTFQTFDFQSG